MRLQTRIHLREALRGLGDQLPEARLALVVAPGGSGKTTLMEAWRAALQQAGHATVWLSIGPGHDAPALLLEDLVEGIRGALGPDGADFGERLLASLPHLDESDTPALVRHLGRAFRQVERPLFLFLDNSHLLRRIGHSEQLIDHLLRSGPDDLHWVLATRGARPRSAPRLLAAGAAFEVTAEDLSLRADQVVDLLAEAGVGSRDVAALLLAETRGWATGVQLAARALARLPPEEGADFVRSLALHDDLFDYVAGEVVADESPGIVELLGVAAILGPCDEATLVEAIEGSPAAGSIDEAIEKGLLLRSEAGLGVHHLWQEFLLRRIRRRSTAEGWRKLHAQMAALVARRDPEGALEIALEGEAEEAVADILTRHGRDWVGRGRYATVQHAFAQLTEPGSNTELRHVAALLAARRDPLGGVLQLEEVADEYRAAGNTSQESMALLDAYIVASNANHVEPVQRIVRRLLSLRRIATDPQARALSMVMLAVLTFSRGRRTLSARILRRVRLEGLPPMIQGATTIGLTIYGRYGDWDETLRRLEEALADPVRSGHAPAFYLLQATRALLNGLRGVEVERSIAEARESAAALRDFRMALSEMVCLDIAGKLESRAGRHVEAREAFERGAELAEAVGEAPLAAAVRGHLALELLAADDPQAAHVEAQRAAALLETRGGASNPMVVRFPAALAARALAECGEAAEAHELALRHEHRFRSPQLPIATHQTALLLARVAHLAGHGDEARARLSAARELAEKSDLRDYGSELDPDLIAWAEAFLPACAPGWEVRSLGGLSVLRDGAEIPERAWRGSTTRRLLTRLLVGDGQARREVLQVDLWPNARPERARGSLRVALTRLRRAIGAEMIHAEGDHIRLSGELLEAWDVRRLRAALDQDGDAAALLDLYRGPFVPELYDDWAEDYRRELEAAVVGEALRRIDAELEDERSVEAARASERLTRSHPLEEDAWLLRARAEGDLGGPSAAARVLEQGRATLERELGPGGAARVAAAAEASRRVTPG